MAQSDRTQAQAHPHLEVVFLGSSAGIQVPAFFCSCETCEAARRDATQRRTRASLALLGEETVLIDAGPDLEFQLEREGIRRPDRIFVTHWHFDHIGGLASLAEPASIAKWPPLDVYLPHQVAHHFDEELAYVKPAVTLHPVQPGDRLDLPDATWEVVKTTHTDHSVGFIVEAARRFAYLVDTVEPPPETTARLQGLDLLVVEASVDELDAKGWVNFSFQQAADLWQRSGIPECVLTHLCCHRYLGKRWLAGFTPAERRALEAAQPGLRFAYDGMRLTL